MTPEFLVKFLVFFFSGMTYLFNAAFCSQPLSYFLMNASHFVNVHLQRSLANAILLDYCERKKFFYSDLACFALLTFCYNFSFQHFLLEMCANVCKMCAKNFCDYVQNCFCNLFGIAFYFAISPFSFYKLLMLLWNSFANSWDLYFLKGIVELERYEAWNLALQINDVTPIKCGNAEIC